MKKINLLFVLVIIFIVSCSKDSESTDAPETFTDIRDGQVYKWVKIGEQTWMAENLRATKFNDGTSIPNVSENSEWLSLSTPAYSWYDNDGAAYKDTYGALYNWYVVNSGKLCPTGWHIPSDNDWNTLITSLGNLDARGHGDIGGKFKETGTIHWQSPNTGATNESGFTALPGGGRSYSNGYFTSIGYSGSWWSSEESGMLNAYARRLVYDGIEISKGAFNKKSGFYVRCVKD